ncbi:hypothetical protein TYRP_005896 [Tyrophagus putrescentiae]|nr:hypothetical protein TYRP_005896 [Tyrophagus putrescentiae]
MMFSTLILAHLLLILCTVSAPVFSWQPQPSSFNARTRNNNFQFQRSVPRPPMTFQNVPKRPFSFNQPKSKPSFVKPLSESYFNRGTTSSFPQFSNNNNNNLFRQTFTKNRAGSVPQMKTRKPLKGTFSTPTAATGSKIAGKFDAPGAYSWGYRWVDESGTAMFREETADGLGTVWGRYSFREPDGRLRIVEYVSDPENGFRTRVRSNEPGIVTSSPANAVIVRFDSEDELADSFDFGFRGRRSSVEKGGKEKEED